VLYLRVGLQGLDVDVYGEHFWELRGVHFEYRYVGLPALKAVGVREFAALLRGEATLADPGLAEGLASPGVPVVPVLFAGGGLLLLIRTGAHADYLTQILPGIAVFGLGMAATVAPLTAAVLSSVETGHSGVASGVNNAVARVAGLLAIAALGAVVSASFTARLDRELRGAPLSAPARTVVDGDRTRALVTDVRAVPPAATSSPITFHGSRAVRDASEIPRAAIEPIRGNRNSKWGANHSVLKA